MDRLAGGPHPCPHVAWGSTVNKTLTRFLSFSLPVSCRYNRKVVQLIDGRMTSAETTAPMDSVLSKMLQPRIEALKVLVVEDDGKCP